MQIQMTPHTGGLDQEDRERELDYIHQLQKDLAEAKVELSSRLTPVTLPGTDPDMSKIVENLVDRVTTLENHEGDDLSLLTNRWPSSTSVAADLAASALKTEAHAHNIRMATARTLGPQALLMLETWASFFTRKVDENFWEIWSCWAGLMAIEKSCTVDRILVEGEAAHANTTMNKLRDMVLCPNMFSMSRVVEVIMTALPVVTYCFSGKSIVVVEFRYLLRDLLAPGMTNSQAIQVQYNYKLVLYNKKF